MEKFLVFLVIVLFIYSLLKPNKKKQNKSTTKVSIQDLQKMLSDIQQQNKTAQAKNIKNKNQSQKQNQPQKAKNEVKEKNYTTLEKTEIEVKTYDENLNLEVYQRSKDFESLDKSALYDVKEVDTETTFEKENQKWLKQTQKDNTEHPDEHRKKAKLTAKDIKKAYITNQILERKYI